MARVRQPKRAVSPSLPSGVAVPPGTLRQSLEREGQTKSQIGQVMRSIGGDFADLAARVQRMHVREEFADSQLTYDEAMNVFLAEQEAAGNYDAWAENTAKKHDELASSGLTAARSPAAKNLFSNWARETRSTLLYKVTTRADSLYSERARSLLRIRMENAVNNGQVDDFKAHLAGMEKDELLVPEETEYWGNEADSASQRLNYQQTLRAVENEALQILSTGGPDAATAFIRDIITEPELEGADKRSLLNLVIFFSEIEDVKAEKVRLEEKRAEISEFTGLIQENKLDPARIEASEHGVTHQAQWKGWLKGSMRPEPDIDWRKVIAFGDEFFDYWGIDKTKAELSLMEARYGKNRYMDDALFNTYLARLNLDLPRKYFGILKPAFEAISRNASQMQWGFIPLNQKEAELAAKARSDLLDWLMEDHLSKRKEVTPEKMYSQAIEFITLYKSGGIVATKPVLPPDRWFQTQIQNARGKMPAKLQKQVDAALKAGVPLKDLFDSDEVQDYLKQKRK